MSDVIHIASPAKSELVWAIEELTLSMRGQEGMSEFHLKLAQNHIKTALSHFPSPPKQEGE